MSQIDIYLLLFLLFSAVIGLIRGFSGELGSLFKLALTFFLTFIIIKIIGKHFPMSSSIFFPSTIFSISYIIISLFSRLLVMPLVYLLRRILPFLIDKPFGVLLGSAKAFLIILVIYSIYTNLTGSIKMEKPGWLEDSYSDIILAESAEFILPYIHDFMDKDSDKNGKSGEKNNRIKTLMNNIGELKNNNRKSKENSKEQPTKEELDSKMNDVKSLMKHYQQLNNLSEDGDINYPPTSEDGNSDEEEPGLNDLNSLMEELESY